MKTHSQPPASRHFRLEPLAEGVWAAIHRQGGTAICNAGIVDLGGRTLVFDTFMAPQPADDLRYAAESLTGRPVDLVVNSHYDNDHIWGNQAFDSPIFSTETTHRLIVATKGCEDYDAALANSPARLEAARAAYAAAQTEPERIEAALWVDDNQAFVDAAPILQVRAPDVTFRGRMTFHGSARSAELLELAGHTPSDAVLLLPEDGIAFLGDLLFVECHPYLGGGDPGALLDALEAVSARGSWRPVPGHGPVGTAESLAQMQAYVRALDGLARGLVEAGEPESKVDALPVPPPFDGWLIHKFFAVNLHFLYQRHLLALGGSRA